MITVIIPVLNAMPYLPEALASLERQSFRDFEICLWDNGSTDGSVEEARRWIPSRLKGRVVTGNPLPLHDCLARMVEEAQTEFVARMDGDDVCLPGRFAAQIAALSAEPKLGLVGGQCIYIGPDGEALPEQEILPLRHEDILTQMLFRSALTHPALMFRKTAILSAGNYKVPKPVEDVDLYLSMSSRWRFLNLDQHVLNYRIHPTSICRTHKDEQAANFVDVVASHAPKVYGLEADRYRELRAKALHCAIFEMLRTVAYRCGASPRTFISTVISFYFVNTARCLTRREDNVSKVLYRLLDLVISKPNIHSATKECI